MSWFGVHSLHVRYFFVAFIACSYAPVFAQATPSTQPAKISFDDFWSQCNQAGCAIFPWDPKDWEARGESKDQPLFMAEDRHCYNGIPVPKDSLSSLPDFFAFAGKDKQRFFIPITKSPEKVVEAGDIMIYFHRDNPDSKSVYEHVTKNRWHAAIVGTDASGNLFHLDSPQSMSGSKFDNNVYHLLRLRKYPPEIKSMADLKSWQSDPKKKKILQKWESDRTKKLKDVNTLIQTLRKSSFLYDSARVTEVSQKSADLKKLRENLEAGKTWPLYCSELPATLYVLAGEKVPKPCSLLDAIERVEKEVIEPQLLKQGATTQSAKDELRAKIIKDATKEMFSDSAVMREFGASDSEISHYRQTGDLPKAVEDLRKQYEVFLLAPKHLRFGMFQLMENAYGGDKGQFVGPPPSSGSLE